MCWRSSQLGRVIVFREQVIFLPLIVRDAFRKDLVSTRAAMKARKLLLVMGKHPCGPGEPSHDRRKIVHLNLTANPSAGWTGRQIVQAFLPV